MSDIGDNETDWFEFPPPPGMMAVLRASHNRLLAALEAMEHTTDHVIPPEGWEHLTDIPCAACAAIREARAAIAAARQITS